MNLQTIYNFRENEKAVIKYGYGRSMFVEVTESFPPDQKMMYPEARTGFSDYTKTHKLSYNHFLLFG